MEEFSGILDPEFLHEFLFLRIVEVCPYPYNLGNLRIVKESIFFPLSRKK